MQEEEGVCAKVRIQISQKVTLTREAFLAKLELENGEASQLTEIRVDVYVRDSESKLIATQMFSFSMYKAIYLFSYKNCKY